MINISLWYKRFYSYINLKYLIIAVLACLHKEGKISDEKLKGQFSSLRKGKLITKKNVYHSTINNRWYNDEEMYEIFKDYLYLIKGYISIEDLIKYIAIYENKNYNYAVNIFGSEYLYRILNYWNPEYHNNSFSDFIGFYIPNVTFKNERYSCYECGRTHYNYDNNETENIRIISEWLHQMKKGNLKKIPFHNINNIHFFI
jgi:hypothetical protein